MRPAPFLLLLAGATGCKQPEPQSELLDTGWFSDTDSWNPEDCTHTMVDVQPAAGETDWYWRRAPQFWTGSTQQERYEARLLDNAGFVVATTQSWADEGLSFTLNTATALTPSSEYTLQYTDCLGPKEHPFQTSALGEALDGGPSSLVGRTWQLDVVNARWVEPGGFAALLQIYFTVPLLVGVEWADNGLIDLVGAPGVVWEDGTIEQSPFEPSWDFPVAGFSEAPYFAAEAEKASFGYSGVFIPVHNLTFNGTFGASGAMLGGGTLQGLGDSRELGVLFGQEGDQNAVCELALSLGVSCEPCPDGEPYCLYLRAEDVSGNELPGVTLKKQ